MYFETSLCAPENSYGVAERTEEIAFLQFRQRYVHVFAQYVVSQDNDGRFFSFHAALDDCGDAYIVRTKYSADLADYTGSILYDQAEIERAFPCIGRRC